MHAPFRGLTLTFILIKLDLIPHKTIFNTHANNLYNIYERFSKNKSSKPQRFSEFFHDADYKIFIFGGQFYVGFIFFCSDLKILVHFQQI